MDIKTVEKPWGKEEWIAYGNGIYIGKLLYIHKGHSISLQAHPDKHETMLLLSGDAIIELDGKFIELDMKVPIEIPPMMKHRIKAITNCKIVEVSNNAFKTIRYEDDYGRAR